MGKECAQYSWDVFPINLLSADGLICLPIDAYSAEFNPEAAHPVIIFMPEISTTHMGGTMRLGLRPTVFEESAASWSVIRKLYGGKSKIWERHRHRYEVNPSYVERLVASGMLFVGKDEKGERMQVCELRGTYERQFFLILFSYYVI